MRITILSVRAARRVLAGCITAAGISAASVAPGQQGPAAWGPQQPPQPSWTDRLLAPFTPDPAAQQAKAAREAAKQRAAHDPLSLANDTGPPSPKLFIAMAEMSQRGGNVAQARQLYQRAIALDERNVDALLGAARMEDRAGNLDVAASLYQRAAAAAPGNAAVLNDLALCSARRGDLVAAERALDQAIRVEPRKALYRNNIAKVLVEANRINDAGWQLSNVHSPAVVQYNLGVLLYQRGRVNEAVPYLVRATTIDPQMGPAHALLAQIHRPATPPAGANQNPTAVASQTHAGAEQSIRVAARPEAAPGVAPASPGVVAQPPVTPTVAQPATPESPTLASPAVLPPVN